ncbi:MAG: hypothetical protein P4L99_11935 [Chthoniobacter sp.]|nr:hypothetical protein [Chthoniobacter sp.]
MNNVPDTVKLCALLLLFPWRAHSGDPLTLDFDEARDHIGQSAVVKGVVAQASLWGKAAFLDFGAAHPDEEFTAVSYNLPFSVLAAFQGKTVSVSGTIIDDKGRPEIVISNLAQIAVIAVIAAIDDPPARTLSLDEVVALADRGEVNERLYLRGAFRVTAAGTSRAVLRDAGRPNDSSPRIVVDYPRGVVLPKEGERFVRDAAHPYRVSDVRRGADGVVTIYVRDTTQR